MTSPTTLKSQPASVFAGRTRVMTEGEELGKKPKKVNSEIRKQQNRIASRNYREKRRIKLQYLEQLINHGSKDEQTPEASPQHLEPHLHTPSADHNAAPSSSSFILAPNEYLMSLNPDSTATIGPIPTSSSAGYGTYLLPHTQVYTPFETPWNHSEYNSFSATNALYTSYPLSWTSGLGQSSRQSHQISPTAAHAGFGRKTSPYQHPGIYIASAAHYPLPWPDGYFDV